MPKYTLYQTVRSYTLETLFQRRIAKWIGDRSLRLQQQRGYRMAIFANDLIGININQFGIYEGEELDVLFDFFKPLQAVFSAGLVLDIGANIGNHSMVFSRRFAAVHAFEPNPATLELLRFNTRRAGNVTAYAHGLGDSSGTFNLVEDQANMGGSSITLSAEAAEHVVKVHIERLDDMSIDLSSLCFVKIDVEGFEAPVLRGAERTLRQTQPLIVLEQHPSDFVNGSTPAIEFLATLGYRFCWQQYQGTRRSWLIRRLLKLWILATGEKHQIVSDNVVPRGHYSMLIAVPPRFAKDLAMGWS
jgi:FkbM family methyltransferase